jgi:hypothetical protein
MAMEKRLKSVPSQAFTANGTNVGQVTVADASLFKVKQKVVITATSLPNLELEVKHVSEDGITFFVGLEKENIEHRFDISAYTTILGAAVFANKQPRPSIPQQEIERLTYEEEPIVARRTVLVDKLGRKIDEDNPLPTTAVLNGNVSVDLDALTPPTKADPDNVLIAGSEDGTKTGIKHAARVDSELDLRVGISDGPNKANVNIGGELSVTDADAIALLASIDNGIPATLGQTTMTASMPVTIASDQTPIPVNIDLDAYTLTPDSVLMVGTKDGTKTGTKKAFVNSTRLQILAAEDRSQDINYLDFGTKDQRIASIIYSSPDFPGITAVKTFTYTLVGNKYRRDSIDWSII